MRLRITVIFLGLLANLAWTGPGRAGADSLEGLLEPKEKVNVASQVPGILDAVLVERGDRVSKGQVLATLKSGVEEAAVNLAKARVEFGRRKASRNEELYKKQLLSSHDKDELDTEIQLAQLELAEAVERLHLRTIRSTVNGLVVERLHAPGDFVGEDSILTLARIDPLNVEVVVPVERFGTIKKGSTGEVRLEEPVGGSHKARVVIVDQVVDAASATFAVRLELPNPEFRIPAGLKCQVRFPDRAGQ